MPDWTTHAKTGRLVAGPFSANDIKNPAACRIQAVDKPRRAFNSFPATYTPGTRFFHQCAHWWKKQTLWSVRRPERRSVSGVRSPSSSALKKPSGFFNALNPAARPDFPLQWRILRCLQVLSLKPMKGLVQFFMGSLPHDLFLKPLKLVEQLLLHVHRQHPVARRKQH